MKTLLAPVLSLLLLTLTMGCQKSDDTVVAQPKTASDFLAETPTFSILNAAVKQAGLADALKATNLTVFAPTDDAFKAKGFTTPESVKNIPVETLKGILRYHLITGIITTKTPELATADNLAVETANPAALYLTNGANGLFVNGAKVTKTDQLVVNGVIHTVGTLLIPPATDAVMALRTRSDMTLLLAAVTRAAAAQPDLMAILNGTTTTASLKQLTIFAPNDAAFTAAGFRTVADINAAAPATLAGILRYHVVPGLAFSNRLQAGALTTLNTSATNRLTLATPTTGITVKGNKNATAATVKEADVLAKNAVIHVIDQVLMP